MGNRIVVIAAISAVLAAAVTAAAFLLSRPKPDLTSVDIAVVGDSYSAGHLNRVVWPTLLAQRAGRSVANFTLPGAGFTADGAGGHAFTWQVDRALAARPDTVLIVGGYDDGGFAGTGNIGQGVLDAINKVIRAGKWGSTGDMTTTLQKYGLIVRARWRWVAWGVVGAVTATAAVLLMWPPLYRSEAMVFVRTPGDIGQSVDGGDSYAQRRAETYAALATSTTVSTRVIADTGLDLSPQRFARRVAAHHIGGTALLQIRVGAGSPEEARRAAQALITELTAEVGTLEAVPGSLTPRAELVVVDPPSAPTRVFAWGAPLYPFVVGPVFLGACLGALAAVIRAMATAAGPGDAAPMGGRHHSSDAARSSTTPEGL